MSGWINSHDHKQTSGRWFGQTVILRHGKARDRAVAALRDFIRMGEVMRMQDTMTVMLMVTAAVMANAHAQGTGNSEDNAIVVTVKTESPGIEGSFTFTGTPEGTTSAGGSLSQPGLPPGDYTTSESAAPPGLVLVSITCDDGDSPTPSVGMVETRQATFNKDAGETVECVFLYRSGNLEQSSSAAPAGGGSGGEPSAPSGGAGGGPSAPGGAGSPSAETECEAPDMVPRAGSWSVSNFPGRMVCGTMINMPLSPSQEDGILEIRDCGWTVIGTGVAEDTAPLTMRAVDATSGRYTGSVGGMQDSISMTIHFNWQLNSEEWIVGDLWSEVVEQGMTCRMTREFELRYAGQ